MVDVGTNIKKSNRTILIEQVGAMRKGDHIYSRVHPRPHHPDHIFHYFLQIRICFYSQGVILFCVIDWLLNMTSEGSRFENYTFIPCFM